MHGERNYPTRKMRSTLDVGLADGDPPHDATGAVEDGLQRPEDAGFGAAWHHSGRRRGRKEAAVAAGSGHEDRGLAVEEELAGRLLVAELVVAIGLAFLAAHLNSGSSDMSGGATNVIGQSYCVSA